MNHDLMLAVLSMDAYSQEKQNIGTAVVNTTVVLPSGSLPAGFFAKAYTYEGSTVISYRGTDIGWAIANDVLNGWAGGVGIETTQAGLAAQFYQSVVGSAAFPYATSVTFTGHSLGGGLAGVMGSLYGKQAVVFDNMSYSAATTIQNFAATFPNSSTKATFYGAAPVMPLDASRVSGHQLDGQALQYTQSTGTVHGADVNWVGTSSFVQKHNSGLLVLQMYADQRTDLSADWKSFAPHVGPQLFVQGNAVTDIAYSVVDEGTRPKGDAAAHAMFDDMVDASRLSSQLSGSIYFDYGATDTMKDHFGSIIVQFANKLANDAVLQNTIVGNGGKGVIAQSGSSFFISVDKQSTAWNGTPEINGWQEIKNALVSASLMTLPASVVPILNDIDFLQFSPGGSISVDLTTSNPLSQGGLLQNLAASNAAVFGALGQHNTIAGGLNNDALFGGDAGNTIVGGKGTDVVVGGAGADILIGDEAVLTDGSVTSTTSDGKSDILVGGIGNDTYYVNYQGSLSVNGHEVELAMQLDLIRDDDGVGTLSVDGLLVNLSGLILRPNSTARYGDFLGMTADNLSFGGKTVGNEIIYGFFDESGFESQVFFKTDSSAASAGFLGMTFASSLQQILGTEIANTLTGTAQRDYIRGLGGSDTINGGGNDDVIDGGEADDMIHGESGNDNVIGENGNDQIFGDDGDDWLDGGFGNDVLDGGVGIDFLFGGEGADTLIVDSILDRLGFESAFSADIDLVMASVTRAALESGYENLTLTGTSAINGTGNSVVNLIIGNIAANVLDGGVDGVLDTLNGGLGDDIYVFGANTIADTIIDAGGIDTLETAITRSLAGYAMLENLTLTGSAASNATGNALNNVIAANAGINVLDGAGGIDTLDYRLSDAFVTINLGTNAASGGYAQGDVISNFENVQASNFNDSVTGNVLVNFLTGLEGIDTIDGGTDAIVDTLDGGLGNDVYVMNNVVSDTIIDAGGADTVQSSLTRSIAALAMIENLSLTGTAAANATGNGLNNVLTGNTGVNTLDGGAGNDTLNGGTDAVVDTLRGGIGNDVFVMNNAVADTIEDTSGTDAVYSTVTRSLADMDTLTLQIENLLLTGTAAANGTGNALANIITGNAGANILNGGIDTVSDTLAGGLANDTYIINTSSDLITEFSNGGTADVVKASVSFALANDDYIETMQTTDAALLTAINLTGNALRQSITGNAGVNILNGGVDVVSDTLIGGLGSDTYIINTSSDLITEFVAGGTADVVQASVSFTLANDDYIETLQTTNAALATAINLTGNALAQSITGNAGANVLNGMFGNDTLTGGLGADTFLFNTTLNAASNRDTITDFNVVADTIQLENTGIFTALGAALGVLDVAMFKNLTTGGAVDATDRILYDDVTGALSYDADGNGATSAIQFATLTGAPTVTNVDFFVI